MEGENTLCPTMFVASMPTKTKTVHHRCQSLGLLNNLVNLAPANGSPAAASHSLGSLKVSALVGRPCPCMPWHAPCSAFVSVLAYNTLVLQLVMHDIPPYKHPEATAVTTATAATVRGLPQHS
jgi:hypothetical protein